MSGGQSASASAAIRLMQEKKENVRVVARFRPVSEREVSLHEIQGEEYSLLIDEKQKVIGMRRLITGGKSKTIVSAPREESHNFIFDKVFGPECTQQRVFEEVARDVVSWIAEGYNSTIFAYGQTGSGKTYTMFGAENGDWKLRGIVPRSVEQLFQEIAENSEIEEVTIKCSFLEIYKENIRDLLRPPTKNNKSYEVEFHPNLRIRQSSDKGTYVQGLIEKYVYSPQDVFDLIKAGEKNRVTSETKMNEVSSRSHAVLTITVTENWRDGSVRLGKLNLVDLAGSENVNKSQATGETLAEAQKINKSLSALGNVIYALTEHSREHVPYRDSKLTYLLQDSLGGNTKTVLLVTCSPHETNYSETLSTLKFAKRAKDIQNNPSINKQESVAQLRGIVAHLEGELQEREAAISEMNQILGTFGVERDENGQFRVPKDSNTGTADAKELNMYKAQVVRLSKKLEKAEKKIEKLEKLRKKENLYYQQLKELFNKQRDLAFALSEKLRQRDQTILFLTQELEEYNEFQATLEQAVAANPGLFASMGNVFHSRKTSQNLRRPSVIEIMKQQAEEDNMRESQMASIEELPPSPTHSEAASVASENTRLDLAISRAMDREKTRDKGPHIVLPFKPTGLAAESVSGLPVKLANGDDEKLKKPNKGKGATASAAVESEINVAMSAQQAEISMAEANYALDLKFAIQILENGGVFKKYPYGGMFSSPSKKQMFYNKDTGQLFYWDTDKKMSSLSKFVPLALITDVHIGKSTPAFQRSVAKQALEDHCFSLTFSQDVSDRDPKDKDAKEERTLDLEAETKPKRDLWVAAIKMVADHLKRRADTPVLRVHGAALVPEDLVRRARLDMQNNGAFGAANAEFSHAGSSQSAGGAGGPVAVGAGTVSGRPRKQPLTVSDYVPDEPPGGSGQSRGAAGDEESADAKDDSDGEESGVAPSLSSVERLMNPRRAGDQGDADGDGEARGHRSRPSDLPGYRFRGAEEEDVEVTREDVLREVRTAEHDTRRIFKKVAAIKHDPLARPAGLPQSASDVSLPADEPEPVKSPQLPQRVGSDSGSPDPRPLSPPPEPGLKSPVTSPSGSAAPDSSPRQSGEKHKCLFDFVGKNELQLSFKKGDVVEVLQEKKGGWWTATLGGRVGSIPYNYVKRLDEWEAQQAAKKAAKLQQASS